MVTWVVSRSQSMVTAPPSMTMRLASPARARRATATPTAQAPLPQAIVMPTPRSQTRMRNDPSSMRLTTDKFTRSGNRGDVSASGPRRGKSTASASSTKTTACGLPSEWQTASPSPSIPSGTASVSSPWASGTSAQPVATGPISTEISAPARQARRSELSVSIVRGRSVPGPMPDSMTRSATHLVPLPQTPEGEPS